MATRTTINVSLTPELEKFVSDKVASGRYSTASEVVRESLRLLEERDAEREVRLGELRAKLQVGLDEARRGELIDGETVIREIRELSRKRRDRDGS